VQKYLHVVKFKTTVLLPKRYSTFWYMDYNTSIKFTTSENTQTVVKWMLTC